MIDKVARGACLACVVMVAGCHQSLADKYKWRAEDYFADSHTIELCDAIKHSDVRKVKELLASRANVNDCGKDGMTPLLWALLDESDEIFQLLLDEGADPTVPTKSDFGTRGKIDAGWTVAHLAAKGKDEEKFRAILRVVNDPSFKCFPPNLPKGVDLFSAVLAANNQLTLDRPRLHQMIYSRIKALLAFKPNQETLDRGAIGAIGCENFESALLLFESGASYRSPYGQWGNTIHLVAQCQVGAKSHSYDGYVKLVAWLESKGEDVVAARADWERWQADIGFDPNSAAVRRKAEIRLRAKKEGTTVDFDD